MSTIENTAAASLSTSATVAKKPTKKERERIERETEARDLLTKFGIVPGARVYGMVVHVSSSGMTRHIRLFTVDPSDNRILEITGIVGRLLGYKRNDGTGGLVVGGCGMDMVWHTIYTLGRVMFREGGPVDLSSRSHQEKRAGKTIEIDGGYLLRNERL